MSEPNGDQSDTQIDDETHNERDRREMTAAFAESVYNGTAIHWRYWVGQMPQLSAGEAARLMCALDPDIFKDLGNRPNKNDPEDLCRKAEMIQRLAERQGQLTATPADWLEWAAHQGIKVHDGFRMEVESLDAGESRQIEFTSVEAGVSTTKRMTQVEYDEEQREKRERQAKGYYTMSEVAQILADTYNLDAAALLKRMKADRHAGNLTIRARDTEAPVLPNHTLRDYYDWMFPDDIRAMLLHWRWSREFPFPAQDASSTPTAASPENTSPDLTLMATREQLIAAFGPFTGMNKAWFDNLKDTPALRDARKLKGQGGRGHIAEPLFCPFEVLQWLTNSARRKGRELSMEKGWHLFEKHFPRAYAAYSVGDPRPD